MVLMGEASFLDDKKKYMDPKTKRVYTGKQWKAFANRGTYDIFDASWFKDYVEVPHEPKRKSSTKTPQLKVE